MKLRPHNFLELLFCALLLLNSNLISQEIFSPVTDKQGWLNIGVGPGKVIEQFEGSIVGSFTYASNRKLVTLRYIYSKASYQRIDYDEVYPLQLERVTEVSLLLGAMKKRRFAFTSLAVGLGYVEGKSESLNQFQNFRTIGVALESQLFLTLPGLGVGIYGYSNINPQTITYGFNIAVQMGKLR